MNPAGTVSTFPGSVPSGSTSSGAGTGNRAPPCSTQTAGSPGSWMRQSSDLVTQQGLVGSAP
jgi:hypothetical protein